MATTFLVPRGSNEALAKKPMDPLEPMMRFSIMNPRVQGQVVQGQHIGPLLLTCVNRSAPGADDTILITQSLVAHELFNACGRQQQVMAASRVGSRRAQRGAAAVPGDC